MVMMSFATRMEPRSILLGGSSSPLPLSASCCCCSCSSSSWVSSSSSSWGAVVFSGLFCLLREVFFLLRFARRAWMVDVDVEPELSNELVDLQFGAVFEP